MWFGILQLQISAPKFQLVCFRYFNSLRHAMGEHSFRLPKVYTKFKCQVMAAS